MSLISRDSAEMNNNKEMNRKINKRTDDSDKSKWSSVRKNDASADTIIKVKSVIPRRRQELLKWYGWGYNDSMFAANLEKNMLMFTGERYSIAGKLLPNFIPWIMEHFNITLYKEHKPPPLPKTFLQSRLPEPIKQELEKIALISVEGLDRLVRAHGQTLRDVSQVRNNSFQRIPDVVIWPESHEQVKSIVELASKHNLVIIPFGGGTSVSGSITCPTKEARPIIALDTSGMNSILWLDKEQLLASVQAGIVGQDLEREMQIRGFTVGHEPDSYEFSTLGGWVATRASGMKKNTYGNIEDLVVHTKTVTPKGVIEKNCRVPRMSCGPEWEHVVMGSEGCFGVVTEVTIKIRPLPPLVRYGSLVFPDWESGFHFERQVAKLRLQPSSIRLMDNEQVTIKIRPLLPLIRYGSVVFFDWESGFHFERQVTKLRLQPSSIRLMDNEQFRFGLALKTESSWGGVILEGLKMAYITRIKGFDRRRLCVVTLLMEGTPNEVTDREKRLNRIAAEHGGVPAGATNGERGYTLTFVIAYIRDLALEYNIVAESFETSVPWDRTLALCRGVKLRVADECRRRNIQYYLISHRLTQTYDAGCCIYFYFGFNSQGCEDPVAVFEEIEEAARDTIVASGGSISHHHGVGKLRKKWYADTVSGPGQELLLATKRTLDPGNIFALGNMAFSEGEPVKSKL